MKLPPAAGRLNRKWAMVGHKGGRCAVCASRVTSVTINDFDFHHKVQVNAAQDKADRWGGGVRDWPPFSGKWFAWAAGVNLICRECHLEEHRPKQRQLAIDWEAQARLDAVMNDA